MLKRIVLLGLLVIAAPAFGNNVEAAAAASVADAMANENMVEGLKGEVSGVDTHLVGPDVARPGQVGYGGNCGYSAPDCPRSTGGCGGRPFWSACNGGAGVCVEACDSFQTGQTMCECWTNSLVGSVGEGMQVAQMLTAVERPTCKRSSEETVVSK